MEAAVRGPALSGARLDSTLRIAAGAVAIVFVVLLTFVPVSTNDFWLQAKIGQIIVENGEIPRTVLFPYTWVRDNVFNAHEWLPSIAFHLFDRALGHDLLLFVQGGVGLALFGLCFSLAWRLSGSLAVGLMLAAMALLVGNYRYHLRPELFALLLLVTLLHVLTRYRTTGNWRTLLWTVPIAIVWANSHGSFLLGPVVAGLFALGEAAEAARDQRGAAWSVKLVGALRIGAPYAATAVAMTAATLVNPQGAELLHLALTLSGSEVTRTFIDEWTPTLSKRFMTRVPFAIFVAALTATLAIVVACRRRLSVTDGLLLLAFAWLALQRTRFVVLFGFITLVVCSRLIGTLPWQRRWERAALAACLAAASAGVGLALNFGNVWGAYPFGSPTDNLTPQMVQRLSRPEMQGNVINSYELGAELIYRAYPRLKPSMDSRIDSYGDRYFLLQEELLINEHLLKEFVSDFDVRYMLLSWRDFGQLKKLKGIQQDWRMQYADHKNVLLERVNQN